MSTPITRLSPATSTTSANVGATDTVLATPALTATTQPARQPSAPATRGVMRVSGASRPLSGRERAVHQGHERDDVEHGTAGLALDVGGVRRHVRALQHDGADVRMLAHEPARHAHVLLAREVHVELELVVEQRA